MGSRCLNEVRPRRPEQFGGRLCVGRLGSTVSMKSGLEGRNNLAKAVASGDRAMVSMKSGLEGRNNQIEAMAGMLSSLLSQ